jgi:tetratricopeptide (TPR) repeat protein
VVSYSKVAKNGIGAKIAIAPSAAPGLYDVIVTSPDARQARSTASFEVRSAPPQPVSTRRAQNSKDAATASTANTVSISPKEQERQIRAAITEGDVLKKLGDYDGAIAAYRKGLQADPADAEVRERIRRAQNAKDAEAAVSKH